MVDVAGGVEARFRREEKRVLARSDVGSVVGSDTNNFAGSDIGPVSKGGVGMRFNGDG